ncbi:MAG: ATP-dependent DNA helicase RecQ [Candidatus Omnitrophota bacterium]|jgi:ATP-dependent DNA helicase RecQ
MQTVLNNIDEVLKEYFGYSNFRHLQRDCIEAVLDKKDTLLIMPTGGGKSLCYQIPAIIFPGLTVVISPLISLMIDQVRQLKDVGIDAEMLNSSLSFDEYLMNKQLVESGQTKILFLAPETLMKPDVMAMLHSVQVDCITIDEAHCISEWGHDFRPEYRQISYVRQEFPKAVCLAMTATATPRVRQDIAKNLKIESDNELIASFNRDNLHYEVIPKMNPLNQVLDFLKGFEHQSGIIYCFSRKQVDQLTNDLKKHGHSVRPYHAGLSDVARRKNQDAFICDKVQIMVATVAFGMGINKPNVRFVVHHDMPKNIEAYYQETGRAGRDGLPSRCLLLFNLGDTYKINFFIDQIEDEQQKRTSKMHLNAMVEYSESMECRRVPLMKYFGETYENKNCELCDNCVNPPPELGDISDVAIKLLVAIAETGETFGVTHVIHVLRGSKAQRVIDYGHDNLTTHGKGSEYSIKQWQFVLRQLVQQDFVRKEEDYGVLKLEASAYQVMNQELEVLGQLPALEPVKAQARVKRTSLCKDFDDYDPELFNILRKRRKEIAGRKHVPPYVIFSDKALVDMSKRMPKTLDEFSTTFGVGGVKLKKYGREFVSIIRHYCGLN